MKDIGKDDTFFSLHRKGGDSGVLLSVYCQNPDQLVEAFLIALNSPTIEPDVCSGLASALYTASVLALSDSDTLKKPFGFVSANGGYPAVKN